LIAEALNRHPESLYLIQVYPVMVFRLGSTQPGGAGTNVSGASLGLLEITE
jgi:hypothetical protein